MAKNREPFIPHTFKRIELSAEQKKAFTKWVHSHVEEVLPRLFEVLQDDYKFSVSHDGDRETYIATLTRKGDMFPNVKCCLSARHNEFDLTVALLLYKHDQLCQENDWDTADDIEEWG